MLEVFPRLIKYRTLPLPSRLVFVLSIDMIGLCLSQYGYSFKENNGYSVYLNNTFNGLAPKMNGLLNLDRSDTHAPAKRYKIVMIVPHVSHIGIKRMKKLHVDGSLDSLVFEKFETCEPCLLVYMHEETPCKWTVWTHLILNHLRHANHTTWAR